MIKTLVFDFGDVFINLDKTAPKRALSKLGNPEFFEKIESASEQFEIGKINTQEFISYTRSLFPKASEIEILEAWNAMLLDFPRHRLEFIKKLAYEKKYQLILLSNTNEAHINWIQKNITFYEEFKRCFDPFYLSHEIQLRKPNKDVFEYVLNRNQLSPIETLFIDDTKSNTIAANKLGIQTWNIDPLKEDVTELFILKSKLF